VLKSKSAGVLSVSAMLALCSVLAECKCLAIILPCPYIIYKWQI